MPGLLYIYQISHKFNFDLIYQAAIPAAVRFFIFIFLNYR